MGLEGCSLGGSWTAAAPPAANTGRRARPSTALSLACRSDTRWAAGTSTLSWACGGGEGGGGDEGPGLAAFTAAALMGGPSGARTQSQGASGRAAHLDGGRRVQRLQRRQLEATQLAHDLLGPEGARGGAWGRRWWSGGRTALSGVSSQPGRLRPRRCRSAEAAARRAHLGAAGAPGAPLPSLAAAAPPAPPPPPGTTAPDSGRARSGSCAADEPVAASAASSASSWRSWMRRASTLDWCSARDCSLWGRPGGVGVGWGGEARHEDEEAGCGVEAVRVPNSAVNWTAATTSCVLARERTARRACRPRSATASPGRPRRSAARSS
jgi:hypothetical protein